MRVGAVKHRACFFAVRQVLYVLRHKIRLLLFVPRLFDQDGATFAIRCPKLLFSFFGVVADERRCRVQNGLRGAVVLLKSNGPCSGPVLFKMEKVFKVRASPRIDALTVVPHHPDIAVLFAECLYQKILQAVRVLVFVH